MNQSLTAYRGWNQNPRLQDVFIAARIQNEPAKVCVLSPSHDSSQAVRQLT